MNPSWEAIKDGKIKIDRKDVNVITKQIDVSYQEVDRVVPLLWAEHAPLLTIHVGLAARESSIRIEEMARHGPYIHDVVIDNRSIEHAPHKELRVYEEGAQSLEENEHKRNYSCKPCDFEFNSTCLNIDRVCDRMNKAFKEGRLTIPTAKSGDAGLFVCEYIYQRSLRICDRCVFIHVPDVERFRLDDITAAIQTATELLIDEILNSHSTEDREVDESKY